MISGPADDTGHAWAHRWPSLVITKHLVKAAHFTFIFVIDNSICRYILLPHLVIVR